MYSQWDLSKSLEWSTLLNENTKSYKERDFGSFSLVSFSNSEAMLSDKGAVLKPRTKATYPEWWSRKLEGAQDISDTIEPVFSGPLLTSYDMRKTRHSHGRKKLI